jgi:hypothetical protein
VTVTNSRCVVGYLRGVGTGEHVGATEDAPLAAGLETLEDRA